MQFDADQNEYKLFNWLNGDRNLPSEDIFIGGPDLIS
jgi:hypothetical protein